MISIKPSDITINFLSLVDEESPAAKTTRVNLQQCQNALDAFRYKSKVTLESVGDKVNSPDPEFSSIISIDGQNLYFTSRRKRTGASDDNIVDPITGNYLEDVFVSSKQENGDWSDPEMLNFSRSNQNEATVALDLNQTTVFLYDDTEGGGDLYQAPIRKNNPFSKIKKLKIPGVNTEFWEPHIAFTGDGNVAYFSSNRPGGYGGRDIYRIVKYGNGEWSEPINMGPEINTEFDEDSPFISVDGKTMYFASNGVKSIGGFDIFLTVFDEDNNWSPPINMGYPINSTGDDLYFTTTVDGKVAYLTSFRPNGQGEKDIYRIIFDNYIPNNNLFVSGNLKTVEDKPEPTGVQITLQCFDCGSDYTIQEIKSTYIEGKFLVELIPNKEYDIIFVNTESGQIKKQSIVTKGQNDEDKVGILLDPEMLEIVQKELDSSYYRLTLRTTPGTLMPKGVEVEIECLDCPEYQKLSKQKLNNRAQSLFVVKKESKYRFTFRDENGKLLLTEDRIENRKLEGLTDKDFIFIYDNPTVDISNIVINPETPKDSLDEITASYLEMYGYYCPLDFTHNFYYNRNGLNKENVEFMSFLDSISSQVSEGRGKVTIYINSSASYVPTRKFKNNQELAETRAKRVKSFLEAHFGEQNLNEFIEIEIESSGVNGPAYRRADLRNLEKYAPFQFVELTVKGILCAETQYFNSKDGLLSNVKIEPVRKEVEVIIPEQKTPIATKVVDTNQYIIIANTFTVERNAVQLVSELKDKGYENAKIFKKEAGYFLVSITSVAGLTEATNFIDIYNAENDANAYIYEEK